VTGWAVFFLGIIAVATLGTAVMQIGLVLYAGRLARRAAQFLDEVERELKPLFASAAAIGRDAARTASLAAAQVDRVDRVCDDLATRIDQTLTVMQQTVIAPAREGMALVVGVRAAIAAFRGLRDSAEGKRAEDEDALFI